MTVLMLTGCTVTPIGSTSSDSFIVVESTGEAGSMVTDLQFSGLKMRLERMVTGSGLGLSLTFTIPDNTDNMEGVSVGDVIPDGTLTLKNVNGEIIYEGLKSGLTVGESFELLLTTYGTDIGGTVLVSYSIGTVTLTSNPLTVTIEDSSSSSSAETSDDNENSGNDNEDNNTKNSDSKQEDTGSKNTSSSTNPTPSPSPTPSPTVNEDINSSNDSPSSSVPVEPTTDNKMGSTAPSTTFATEVFNTTNSYRTSNNKTVLTYSTVLEEYAQNWAETMASTGNYSHSDPSTYLPSGWEAYGENILKSTATTMDGATAVDRWWESEAHKTNILNNNYNYIGVGYAKNADGMVYMVQLFAQY